MQDKLKSCACCAYLKKFEKMERQSINMIIIYKLWILTTPLDKLSVIIYNILFQLILKLRSNTMYDIAII